MISYAPSGDGVWFYQDFKSEKLAQQNAMALRSLMLGDVKVEYLSTPEPTMCFHSIDDTGGYGNYQCTYPEGKCSVPHKLVTS